MKWWGILVCLVACSSPPPESRPLIDAPPTAGEASRPDSPERPEEPEPATVEEAREQLEAARAELIRAEGTYTADSEEVQALRARCERLQERLRTLEAADAK